MAPWHGAMAEDGVTPAGVPNTLPLHRGLGLVHSGEDRAAAAPCPAVLWPQAFVVATESLFSCRWNNILKQK